MYAIAVLLLFSGAALIAVATITHMIDGYGRKAIDALRLQHVPRATLQSADAPYLRVRTARTNIAFRGPTQSSPNVSHAA